MIMADDERRAPRARSPSCCPLQQEDFEGIFEAMGGLPGHVRLLDPPLHEFLPLTSSRRRGASRSVEVARIEQSDDLERARDARCASASRRSTRRTRCSARAACRLGILYPEIYEMQVEAIMLAAAAVRERSGAAPQLEIMVPLVDYEHELRDHARDDRARRRRATA